MSGDAPLPEHARRAYLSREVGRELRRLLRADPGAVALVAREGASLPELGAGEAWRAAGGHRVARVPLERAVEVARARAERAAADLAAEPPPRCARTLYLDAGQRCAVVPFPIVPPPAASGDA